MLTIIPIYAGLLGLLFFWLSLRVSLLRLQGPAADDTAKARLQRVVRAQGNAAEYMPMGLILLLVLEFQGAPGWLLHLFALMLLAGRIGHFIGFDLSPNRIVQQYSMVLTYCVLFFSSIAVLYFAMIG